MLREKRTFWRKLLSLPSWERGLKYNLIKKIVCVLDPKGEYRGIARGINDQGELLVERPDGTVEEVYAGEVSVRGIYGYV